ncbi:MAG: TlpA disulfide reductase family protein [Bellilinea sp.]
MNWKTVVLLAGGLLIGIIFGVMIFLSGNPAGAMTRGRDVPEIGKRFPDFTLEKLAGGKLTFSNLNGKPTVINFWATWCDPCREEMPLLQQVAQNNQDVEVLGVNYNESTAAIEPFVEFYQITFDILLDVDGKIAGKFQVFGFPTTYFVDREGILRAIHVGQLDEDLMRIYLEKIGLTP